MGHYFAKIYIYKKTICMNIISYSIAIFESLTFYNTDYMQSEAKFHVETWNRSSFHFLTIFFLPNF